MVSKILTALAAVAGVASAASSTNAAKFNAYWGQSGPAEEKLRDRCDEGADYISLSFVLSSPENQPTGYPAIGFAAHCWATGFKVNGVESKLLDHCGTIIEDLQYCRDKGTKMLLSIGGVWNQETADYRLSSEKNGREFADFLWGAFGPYDASWTGPRPFDKSATERSQVDGFDFDLELPKVNDQNFDNKPWIAMADQFRKHSKDVIITGAPQCPTDASNFAMKEMIQKTQFDALFIQFYNNVGCDLIIGNDVWNKNDDFNYADWEKIIADSDKSKNAKLFVGVPAAPDPNHSAWDGYVPPSALEHIICKIAKRPSFGGISIWDMWAGKNNIINGKSFNEHVQDILTKCGNHITTTTTTTTTTTSTTSSTTSTTTTTTTSSSSSTTTSSTTSTPTSTSTSSTSTSSSTSSQPTSSSTTSSQPTSSSSSTTSSQPTSSSSSTSSKPTSTSATSSQTTSSSSTTSSVSTSTSSAVPTSSSSSSSATPTSSETSSSSSTSAVPTSSETTSSSAVPTSSSSSVAPTSSETSSSSAIPTSSSSSSSVAPTSSETSSSSAVTSSSSSAVPTSETSSSSAVPTSQSSSSSAVPTSVSSSSSSVIITTGPATTSAPVTSAPWSNSTTTTSDEMTTSTVFTTTTYTITSCAPTVTNCPVGHVTTETVYVSTTVCPVTKTTEAPQPTGNPGQPGEEVTTSTVYATKTFTITKCAPTVTNCPVGHVVTQTVSVSETVCPVTKTNGVPQPSQPAGGKPSGNQPSPSMTTTTLHSTMTTTVTKTLSETAPKKTPVVVPSQPANQCPGGPNCPPPAGSKCPGGPNCPPAGTGAPSAPVVKPTTPVVTGGASSVAAGLLALVAAQIFLL